MREKMNGRIFIAVAGAVALWAGVADAAPQVTFDVQPTTLTLGEPAVATFTISGASSPPPPSLPRLDGIRVEPSVNRSLQTSVVGSRVTTSTTFRYRLLPLKEGRLTVGPVAYQLDGKTYTLPAIDIQVAPRPEAGSTSNTGLQDRLFATLTTEQPGFFIQESFDVVLSIYSRDLRFGSGLRLLDLPNSGLEFQDFRELDTDRKIINQKVYDVHRYQARARGVTSGVFKVQPTLNVPVVVRRQSNRPQSPFDRLFSSMNEQVEPVTVLPELLTLEIKALPDTDRPTSFSGAVGHFTFQVQAQPQELQAGDPITLTMQIVGEGNMDAVSAPTLELGKEFKVYDSRLVSKRMNDSRTGGEKVFEKVIIPRSDQIAEVPEIKFSYFEPATATYRTLQQGPFHLEISANTNAIARVIQAAPDGLTEPVELSVLKNDIRYLKPAPTEWVIRTSPPWHARILWRRLQLLPPALALIATFATRRRRALERDQARSRRRRAPRQASAGLQSAREARADGDNRGFFEAVWEALSTYFGNRLNLAPGEVSADRVAARFREAGMEAESLDRIHQIFELCEQVRFGHGFSKDQDMTESDQRNADIILEKLGDVIRSCEKIRL